MNGFLVGSNGRGITFLFFGYASGGKLCYYTIFAEMVHAAAAGFVYSVAMSREGLVLIVLVGLNGDIETRRLWRDSVFFEIFAAYVDRAGYDPAVTRFYHLNSVVEWDSTPADHEISNKGRINVVGFGWIFSAANLDYFDQWEEPPPSWERSLLSSCPERFGLH